MAPHLGKLPVSRELRALADAEPLLEGTMPLRGESIRFFGFPLRGVGAMSASTGRTFPRHTHDEYGIGIVDRGGHASWSARGPVEAGRGQFISVNPGEVHDGRPIGASRAWRILYFEPEALGAELNDIDEGRASEFVFARPVFTDPSLCAAFERAFACTQGPIDPLACESAVLGFVARLRAHSTKRVRRKPGPTPPIRRARERIDADPALAVTLAELAAEANLSRYQLLRAFVRELGLTPHAYIIQRRITVARRLIREGHGLADVAIEAGFCDQSHLTRCFRAHVGVTPRRYADAVARCNFIQDDAH